MTDPQPFVRTGLLHVPQLDLASGEAMRRALGKALPRVVILQESYAASDRRWVEDTLCKWCDEEELDLVLTLGGTMPAPGPSGQEIVPEATAAVAERMVPGLGEAMRAYVREEFPAVSLHRGLAGIRGRSLIVNLPSGAEVATLFLEAILEELPYLLAHLRGDTQAVTLAEIVRGEVDGMGDPADISTPQAGEPVPRGDVEKPAEDQPAKATRKGLNAEEFAAFLRRNKPDDI